MSSLTKAERVGILREKYGDNCAGCHIRMDFTLDRDHPRAPTIDHKIPRAAGGTNALWNLQLMHKWPCNQHKGALHEGIDYAIMNQEKEWHTSTVPTVADSSIAESSAADTLTVTLGDLVSVETLLARLGLTSSEETSPSDLAEAS
jgi:hypothetical protein